MSSINWVELVLPNRLRMNLDFITLNGHLDQSNAKDLGHPLKNAHPIVVHVVN